jgi:hypothetical protein
MYNILKQDMNKLLPEKKINRLENIGVHEVEIVEAGLNRAEELITVKFYADILDYEVDEKSGQVLSGSSSGGKIPRILDLLSQRGIEKLGSGRNHSINGFLKEKSKNSYQSSFLVVHQDDKRLN